MAALTFVSIPLAPDALFGVAQRAHVATWMSWLIATMIRARSLAAGGRAAESVPAAAAVEV